MRVSLASRLAPFVAGAAIPVAPIVEGRLTRMVGLTLESVGCAAAVGDRAQGDRAHESMRTSGAIRCLGTRAGQ